MGEAVKVTVTTWTGGRLYLRWTDPETGRRRGKSAGIDNWSTAERKAGELEKELVDGKHASGGRMPWDDFTTRYFDQVAPGLAAKTRNQVRTVLNRLEVIVRPKRAGDINASRLSGFQAKLREAGLAEATIKSYLAHLAAVLSWGVDVGILASVPKMPKVQRGKQSKIMKGRPITTEEFERMLAAVPKVVLRTRPDKQPGRRKTADRPTVAPKRTAEQQRQDAAVVESWKHYLRGLWWSGLRLAESLELYWDDRPDKLSVDLSGRRPMLRIPAAMEKGNRDRVLPVAPEFAEFLLATPEDDRRGRVFKLRSAIGQTAPMKPDWVSRVVCRIGEKANVKVNVKRVRDRTTGELVEVAKFASAHDLRRSFGERWAVRVMPVMLRELMRHESIETTLKYYVGRNAQTTADALWAAFEGANGNAASVGNTFGNTEAVAATANEKGPT